MSSNISSVALVKHYKHVKLPFSRTNLDMHLTCKPIPEHPSQRNAQFLLLGFSQRSDSTIVTLQFSQDCTLVYILSLRIIPIFFLHRGQLFSQSVTQVTMHSRQKICLQQFSFAKFSVFTSSRQIAQLCCCFSLLIFAIELRFSSTDRLNFLLPISGSLSSLPIYERISTLSI